jgi:outer membrane receptor protein involved in Fe transport
VDTIQLSEFRFRLLASTGLRGRILAAAGATAIALVAPIAHAQDVPADTAEEAGEEITVTGSRIVRDGYSAPTPVSVISGAELTAESPANVSDFVNTLPSVRGSSTAANSSGSLSNGLAGISSINLRALGPIRTLVLFDGQRSVPSAANGVVDVNTFPQALIERVEVVTGGASSAYGSDAVSGVVNFILDRDFTGMKVDYEYGVTTYGDGPNHKISLAGGKSFADGRGHFLASAEYFTQKGQHSVNRDWAENNSFYQIDNPAYSAAACTDSSAATVCLPARLAQSGVGMATISPGGLISTGPLRGTYFGTINPATGRATTGTAVLGPTNGQWMVGGDYEYLDSAHANTNTLIPDEDRLGLFGRLSYEFSPAIEVFGQVSYSEYEGTSYYMQTPSTGVVIQRDNAYLPDSVRAAMVTNNLTNISIGTSNVGIGAGGSNNRRTVARYVAGANGAFEAVGAEWKWDGYYQKGVTKSYEQLVNTWNTAKMAAATDAVFAPAGNAAGIAAGTIVCRSTLTAPTNGCVPINRIGVGGVTSAALNYVMNGYNQPFREQTFKQDVAALTFSTANLVDLWAGPISVAFGAEYRKESIAGAVDPQFNSGWLYGNYLVTTGEYDVKEAFFETIIPIFTGLEFNGAVRVTDYSTSGMVTTYKAGLTWKPIDDVMFRGTYSRDIRAPNLSELYAAPIGRTNTVNVPLTGGGTRADEFVEQTLGNPGLTPEVAKSFGGGVVVTPTFLPGFAASVDYYNIELSGAIGSVSAQSTVNLCYEQNVQAYCNSLIFASGSTTDIQNIRLVPFNFAAIKTQGIDFEVSYRRPVASGNMTLRALATHYIELYTNNGVDVPTDQAGQNGGIGGNFGNGTSNVPNWNFRVSAGYDSDTISFSVIGRGISSGVRDNSFVVCETACPVSTVANRTINDNTIDGAAYMDLNFSYTFNVSAMKTNAFVSIRNVLDTDPVMTGNGPSGAHITAYPDTNRDLYDVLGRVFRVGMRFAF